MNRGEPTTPHAHPWLYVPIALGCAAGLFFNGLINADGLPDSAWFLPVYSLFAALFLPLLGIVTDRSGNRALPAVTLSAFLLILLCINYLLGFSIPAVLLVPFVIFMLVACLVLHLALLADHNGDRRRMPAYSLAVLLGCWGALMLADTILPLSVMRVVGTLIAFLSTACLVLFGITARADDIHLEFNDIGKSLRSFFTSDGPHHDIKVLLVCAALYMAGLAPFAADNLIQISTLTAGPALLILTAALGATATRSLTHAYGLFRTLIASALAQAVLVNLHLLFSPYSTIINFLLAFLMGMTLAAILGLAASLTPRREAGLSFGLLFLVCALGIWSGLLVDAVTGQLYFTAPLTLLALFLIQTVSPPHEPSGNDSETLGLHWPNPQLSGLAAHTTFSRGAQILARILAELFFGRVRVVGRENLPIGPVIFVANHPNTFLDAVLLTAVAPGRIHYWAKATLWKLPIAGSILDRLGAIPVYRKQDGDQNATSGNRRALSGAAARLNGGAHILIFPEGVSQPGLSLKPIKTGAARLGFSALAESDWAQDIPMMPVTLDYAEPTIFRTAVTVRIGKPVSLAEHREAYEENPRKTVKTVTETLSERLKQLLPHLDEPSLEGLVHQITDLYGERVLQILNQSDETSARKAVTRAVNHYQRMDPDTVFLFHQRIQTYYQEEDRLKTPENHAPIPISHLFAILLSMFSFAGYGLVINWIPYRLTGRVVEWFLNEGVWTATAKLFLGGFIFSSWYFMLGAAVYMVFGPLFAVLVVLSAVLSAFAALGALERFAFRFRQMKTLWQAFWTQDTSDDLEAMKVSLLQDLERFRESYEFYQSKETESW